METRPLATHAEYEACVDLQRATWGSDFRELVGPAMLKISQRVGGICAGTFEGDRLLGFVYGLTGWEAGSPVHWSHMLAVTSDRRDHGIGRRLKEYQRDQLLAMGVERMLWTYDPLVARNAHLNLNRLGARILEYVPDMYGTNAMSSVDSVIGTDRFIVEWNMTTKQPDSSPAMLTDAPIISLDTTQMDTVRGELPDNPRVMIEIPGDIQTLKQQNSEEALAWRDLVRAAFIHYGELGHTVFGLARGDESRRAFYILERR